MWSFSIHPRSLGEGDSRGLIKVERENGDGDGNGDSGGDGDDDDDDDGMHVQLHDELLCFFPLQDKQTEVREALVA